MRSAKAIVLGIKEPKASANEFVNAWEQAKPGRRTRPQERSCFEDLPTLLKLLTPQRLATLRALRQQGPLSVRKLARAMDRDYKNAFDDVRALERAGLITRSGDGKPTVTWSKIVAEFDTAA